MMLRNGRKSFFEYDGVRLSRLKLIASIMTTGQSLKSKTPSSVVHNRTIIHGSNDHLSQAQHLYTHRVVKNITVERMNPGQAGQRFTRLHEPPSVSQNQNSQRRTQHVRSRAHRSSEAPVLLRGGKIVRTHYWQCGTLFGTFVRMPFTTSSPLRKSAHGPLLRPKDQI
jgi:hypothetical protein